MANTIIEKKISGSKVDRYIGIYYRDPNIDTTLTGAVTNQYWSSEIQGYDKNKLEVGSLYITQNNLGTSTRNYTGIVIEALRVVNGTRLSNNLKLLFDDNGQPYIDVNQPEAWHSKLNYVSRAGDTMTGDLLFSNSGTNLRQIHFTMGDNDKGRIAVGATTANAGWMEIATADDATEPIYVRQYTGNFVTGARTLSLLDSSGNTGLPGKLYWTTFGLSDNIKDAIHYIGTQQDSSMIRFIDGNDPYGNGISIGGGGLTLIGGGESAINIQSVFPGSNEQMIMANDADVEIWSGVQNGATDAAVRKSFFTTNGGIKFQTLGWDKTTTPTANTEPGGLWAYDKNNALYGYITFGKGGGDARTRTRIGAIAGDGTSNILDMYCGNNSNRVISVSDPGVWRRDLGFTYKVNDVWSISVPSGDYHICCPGFVSAGGTTIWFSLHTDKSMENISTIAIQTLVGSVRTITQYIGSGNNNLLTDTAFSGWAAVKTSNYTITLKTLLKTAYTNNNTPLSLSLTNLSFKFT